MKVLMLGLANDLNHDGRVLRAAETMGRAGHEVIAVGRRWWGVPGEEARENHRILRLPVGPFPIFPGHERLRHLPRLLRERPDLVHVHDVHALTTGLLLSKASGAALVYDSHELWHSLAAADPSLAWATRSEAIALPWCSAVIVPAASIGGELRRIYRFRSPVFTVRNVPEDIEPRLPGRVSWPPDRTLFFSGAVKAGNMLEDIRDLLLSRDDLHLLLAGKGDLEFIFDHPELDGRVHRLGMLKEGEVLGAARTATIGLALRTVRKGETDLYLPNKIFEYIRAGIPVLATDLPEMRSLIEETSSGLLIPPCDTAGMERAIDAILSRLDEFRARAAESAHRYPWSDEARVLIELYEAISSGRMPSR